MTWETFMQKQCPRTSRMKIGLLTRLVTVSAQILSVPSPHFSKRVQKLWATFRRGTGGRDRSYGENEEAERTRLG